jgi:hypothetical protein
MTFLTSVGFRSSMTRGPGDRARRSQPQGYGGVHDVRRPTTTASVRRLGFTARVARRLSLMRCTPGIRSASGRPGCRGRFQGVATTSTIRLTDWIGDMDHVPERNGSLCFGLRLMTVKRQPQHRLTTRALGAVTGAVGTHRIGDQLGKQQRPRTVRYRRVLAAPKFRARDTTAYTYDVLGNLLARSAAGLGDPHEYLVDAPERRRSGKKCER